MSNNLEAVISQLKTQINYKARVYDLEKEVVKKRLVKELKEVDDE